MKSKLLEKLRAKVRGKYWQEEFLVAQLADRNADKRREAVIRLEGLEYCDLSELIAAVMYQFRYLRKSKVGYLLAAYSCLLVLFVVCANLPATGYELSVLIYPVALCALSFPGLLIVMCLSWLPLRFRTRNLKRGLARLDDLRIVGLLIDVHISVIDHDPEEGLIRLLPRLRASDTNLLTSSQRLKLCRMLVRTRLPLSEHDKNLKIAILKAFEQVGDGEAVPYVQSHLDLAAHLPPDLREAAEACLPFLLARAEQTKTGHGLLRAAQAPSGDLLRPSQNADSSSPEMLPRAVKSKDEG